MGSEWLSVLNPSELKLRDAGSSLDATIRRAGAPCERDRAGRRPRSQPRRPPPVNEVLLFPDPATSRSLCHTRCRRRAGDVRSNRADRIRGSLGRRKTLIPFAVTFQITKHVFCSLQIDGIYVPVTNSATWAHTLTHATRRWPSCLLHALLVPTISDHGVVTPPA